MEDEILNFDIQQLGDCRVSSPLSDVQFVKQDESVLYYSDPKRVESFYKAGLNPNWPDPAVRYISILPN